jgi:hypothetical protein
MRAGEACEFWAGARNLKEKSGTEAFLTPRSPCGGAAIKSGNTFSHAKDAKSAKQDWNSITPTVATLAPVA